MVKKLVENLAERFTATLCQHWSFGGLGLLDLPLINWVEAYCAVIGDGVEGGEGREREIDIKREIEREREEKRERERERERERGERERERGEREREREREREV